MVGVMLAVAACGLAPPDPTDAGRPGYGADLAACQTSGHAEAHRLVMSKGELFLLYPISMHYLERSQVRKCLEGKNYNYH